MAGLHYEVCQCERPTCGDCRLPVRVRTDGIKTLILPIKNMLISPEFIETFPDDKLERALLFTLDTFDLDLTKAALERKDPSTSLLSSFFSEIEEDHKPLLNFIKLLNLEDENPDIFQRMQHYVLLLKDWSDTEENHGETNENLVECVRCSSPSKSSNGEPVYPRLLYQCDGSLPGRESVVLSEDHT